MGIWTLRGRRFDWSLPSAFCCLDGASCYSFLAFSLVFCTETVFFFYCIRRRFILSCIVVGFRRLSGAAYSVHRAAYS